MSIYTEAEHAIALTDTLYWINHPPITPVQRYLFGRYHYRLKDFNEAFHWLCLALSEQIGQAWFDIAECIRLDLVDSDILENHLHYLNTALGCKLNSSFPDTSAPTIPSSDGNVFSKDLLCKYCYKKAWSYYKEESTEAPELPEGESLYRCGFLLMYGYGTVKDTKKACALLSEVTILHQNLTPDDFNICCDYSNAGTSDGGTVVSAPTEICKLPVGTALFELAKYELRKSNSTAFHSRMLLKKAYDFHCEDALFFDFSQFGKDYSTYEYQDDIRELFSFRIGQYTRVHDINPSIKALDRLARMYEDGYPGDDEARRKVFAMKAVPLRKKIAFYFSNNICTSYGQ